MVLYEKTAVAAAYAKINLFLDVTGRRPDGYHTVAGVMQTVDLADAVAVSASAAGAGARGGPEIVLSCSDPSLPRGPRNLAYRAAAAFSEAAGLGAGRLEISLRKRIPVAAGLAGGSADAAAVLRALNALSARPLPEEALFELALSLGADVPFCLAGGTMRAEGVGEILRSCAPLPPCEIVLAAGEGVPVADAYGLLDERYGGFAPSAYTPRRADLEALMGALAVSDAAGIGRTAFNLFETVILPLRPDAARARGILRSCGASCALMSGSGPSVFGLFGGEEDAGRALSALRAAGLRAVRCRPVGAAPPAEVRP